MAAPAQAVLALALAAILSTPAPQPDTFSNIPPTLSGSSTHSAKPSRRRHEAGADQASQVGQGALMCTTKCVGTCIRGGGGAPGEGPLNVRKPLVVFKDGFRTRQYWYAYVADTVKLNYW
ncbi:hypothetical protein PR202_ga14438 [Eleusine coracana subsp. coracana]|uniref:Uncharacterized protein n=1 Tax=Eleusine coracana subsp. coracana TaxID=191504 RepID=A0AAV5CHK4_ELECO|nr:hypothetical protein PR202_ga14438 [Eleusine coracana subsp. coracana]